MTQLSQSLRGLALVTVVAGMAACAPTVDQRGKLPEPEALAAIQPGVQNKAAVTQLLGTPSNVGTFSDKTWYYISKKTETIGFFKPEVLDQKVVIIRFDDKDVVKSVDTLGPEAAQEVAVVDRETPTAGHSIGILEQLFGNIGRFSSEGGPGGTQGGAGSGRR